jgi:hypothetical protein
MLEGTTLQFLTLKSTNHKLVELKLNWKKDHTLSINAAEEA